MKRQLNVHFLPNTVDPDRLAGRTAVVIDVLRASTVIVHAAAAGATRIVPCLEVDDARQLAAKLPVGEVVLGGERDGVRIEGFDLGNSPEDYTVERVGGRTVVFTTTNGTRAMHACRTADRVVIAALVNLRAVCESLSRTDRVEVVCAGTNRQVSREDVLAAGAIVASLGEDRATNDPARMARGIWQSAKRDLGQELRDSQGGRNLMALGLESDIDAAATVDRFRQVPMLDPDRWEITLPDTTQDC